MCSISLKSAQLSANICEGRWCGATQFLFQRPVGHPSQGPSTALYHRAIHTSLTHARQSPGLKTMHLLKSDTLPLTFFPKPIEDTFLFACSLVFDFSLMTSSSPATSAENFFFFFFLCRGGSFFGKVNIGNITRNIAMAQRRNPLHLKNWEM